MQVANGSAPPRLASNNQRRKRNLISLTPLIDVVFILLVFFMLASTFLNWRAIELDPPKRAGADASMTGAMLVEVRSSGVRLAGQAVAVETLITRLTDRLREDPEQRVLVKPAAGVSLQRTISVLDELTAAGAKNVSLIRGGRS
jgi:biopolymer transport protein ExbD